MHSKSDRLNTNPVVFLPLFLALSGCAAVWGAAHKTISADSNGIKIQYDPSLTSTVRAQVLAREHCKQFSKVAEPVSSEMPGILLGIIEETYTCVTPTAAKP